ncbi:MAG: hypothetical protein QG670_2802, partial [Thermoproteota archaeon]|nr:hypothetical protein [Thermoproteota archaeon]
NRILDSNILSLIDASGLMRDFTNQLVVE